MKVCHRDLKPGNLMLDEDEKQIYLIDLGESKKIIPSVEAQTKNDITIAGSPKYFSPELDQAFKNNDQKVKINPFKSDVFSFGLTFLELGTLKVPKKDLDFNIWEKNIQKLIKTFQKTYEPFMQEESEMKTLLRFVKTLKKCLRMEPDERPDFVSLFCKKIKNTDSDIFRQHILFEEKGINVSSGIFLN